MSNAGTASTLLISEIIQHTARLKGTGCALVTDTDNYVTIISKNYDTKKINCRTCRKKRYDV